MINRTRTIKPQFIYDLAAKNKQRVVVCRRRRRIPPQRHPLLFVVWLGFEAT